MLELLLSSAVLRAVLSFPSSHGLLVREPGAPLALSNRSSSTTEREDAATCSELRALLNDHHARQLNSTKCVKPAKGINRGFHYARNKSWHCLHRRLEFSLRQVTYFSLSISQQWHCPGCILQPPGHWKPVCELGV